MFGDEVLATAILDRLLHHCDVISINAPATDSRIGSQPSSETGTTRPETGAHTSVLDGAPRRVRRHTFAFDEFGPLGIRPTAGSCRAEQTRPDRLPATYRRTHGITYFHGCYSVGNDQMWGINRRRKGIDHTWAALKTIRAARPDGAPFYVILDNLSAHLNWRIRRWAARNKVKLCFTATFSYRGSRPWVGRP